MSWPLPTKGNRPGRLYWTAWAFGMYPNSQFNLISCLHFRLKTPNYGLAKSYRRIMFAQLMISAKYTINLIRNANSQFCYLKFIQTRQINLSNNLKPFLWYIYFGIHQTCYEMFKEEKNGYIHCKSVSNIKTWKIGTLKSSLQLYSIYKLPKIYRFLFPYSSMSTPCNPPFTSFYLPFLDWLQPPLYDHGPITAENHTLDVTYSRRKKIQNIFSNQQLLSMIHLQRTAEQDYAWWAKEQTIMLFEHMGCGIPCQLTTHMFK